MGRRQRWTVLSINRTRQCLRRSALLQRRSQAVLWLGITPFKCWFVSRGPRSAQAPGHPPSRQWRDPRKAYTSERDQVGEENCHYDDLMGTNSLQRKGSYGDGLST